MISSPESRYPTPLRVDSSRLIRVGEGIIERYTQDSVKRAEHGEDFQVATVTWNLEPILYGIDKYVAGELDFTSPAEHGYGRVPGDLARLGAYHRSKMSRLAPAQLASVRDLIIDIMLATYVGACVFLRPPAEPHGETNESFFGAWSRKVYVSQIDDNFRTLGRLCGDPDQERLSSLLHELGLRGGLFGIGDKTPLLTYYYSFGGWGLRLTELNPHPNRPQGRA